MIIKKEYDDEDDGDDDGDADDGDPDVGDGDNDDDMFQSNWRDINSAVLLRLFFFF